MRKIKFSVKANRSDDGMLSIVIKCEQFGKSIEIDTNVKVFKDEWDTDNASVTEENPNHIKLNKFIKKTLYELEEYELDFNSEFTLSKLRDVWECRESTHDFYSMMEHQIKTRDIRNTTRQTNSNTLRHLKLYRKECNMSDLTEDFAKGFQRYLREQDLNESTVRAHIRTFRCYYNIARKLFGSKVPNNSFDFYHEKLSDRLQYKMKALNDNDIRLIENYVSNPFTPKKEVFCLERFLFMSYTGVRISDFTSFTEKNFHVDNGITWLSYVSVKTCTPVKIPITAMFNGRAEQLLSKYKSCLEEFFQITDRPHFNIQLDKYAHKAGVDKHVTAHVARHTCASRLVNKDIPITTIQQVIGHRSLKMTMVYAKTNENTLLRQLDRF